MLLRYLGQRLLHNHVKSFCVLEAFTNQRLVLLNPYPFVSVSHFQAPGFEYESMTKGKYLQVLGEIEGIDVSGRVRIKALKIVDISKGN
jgi:hypothetical protein